MLIPGSAYGVDILPEILHTLVICSRGLDDRHQAIVLAEGSIAIDRAC